MKRVICTYTDLNYGRCRLQGDSNSGHSPCMCHATEAFCKVHKGQNGMGECRCPLDDGEDVILVYRKKLSPNEKGGE